MSGAYRDDLEAVLHRVHDLERENGALAARNAELEGRPAPVVSSPPEREGSGIGVLIGVLLVAGPIMIITFLVMFQRHEIEAGIVFLSIMSVAIGFAMLPVIRQNHQRRLRGRISANSTNAKPAAAAPPPRA